MLRAYLLLLLGVFSCSTAAIMIKASTVHPVLLSAVRLLLSTLLLSPLFFRALAAHRGTFTREHLRSTTLPALMLAAHFISWSYGARMTLTAQAALIVNLAPVALPFFLHALLGETVTRKEIIGTIVAISGISVLSARDAFSGGGDLLGNIVCFGSMLFFAWYLALGRRNRGVPSLWLYMVPVYLQAGLFCAIAALPWWRELPALPLREFGLLAGLALIPTIVGHTLLNQSMRTLRGQVVSLCNVGQFIFAGIMAFFLFGESPAPAFYAASALVVAGIALVVLNHQPAPPRMR